MIFKKARFVFSVPIAMICLAATGAALGQPGKGKPFLALPSAAELEAGKQFTPAKPADPPARKPMIESLNDLLKKLPKEQYDLATRATSFAKPVADAFAFVRDEIRFEAYAGVFRGAEHTFLAKAGNAHDRSLLLAELLKARKVPVQFARGALDQAAVDKLYARIFDTSPAVKPREAKTESLLGQVRGRAVRDYGVLRAVLGQDFPSKAGVAREQVNKEIQDHVWVRAQVEGEWLDLDSAFADAKPGQTFAKLGKVSEALPPEAYQQVTIRVLAETLSANGDLKVEKGLEVKKPVAAVLDRQIYLLHGLNTKGGLEGALAGGLGGGQEWFPILYVHNEYHTGKPIIYRERAGNPLVGGGPALVGHWLEFEIALPGGQKEVVRRVLLDRLGMVGRLDKAIDAAKMRPTPCQDGQPTSPREVHSIWFSAGKHHLPSYVEICALLVKAQDIKDEKKPLKRMPLSKQLLPFGVSTFAALIASDHAVVPALNDLPGIRLYADSPRIFMTSIGPDERVEKGTQVLVDLRRDHLRGLAKDPADQPKVAERLVWFGLLQGALEHQLGMPHLALEPKGQIQSTSGTLADDGVIVLRPTDRDPQPPPARETAARAAVALGEGHVLVMPKSVMKGGVLAWWEVSPTGATRAVLGDDWNGGMFGPLQFPPGRFNPPTQIGPQVRLPTRIPGMEGGLVDNPNWPHWNPGEIPREPPVNERPINKQGATEYLAMVVLGATAVAVIGYVVGYYYADAILGVVGDVREVLGHVLQ